MRKWIGYPAVLAAVALFSASCSKSTSTVTTPTVVAGDPTISNLQAQQLGLAHEVCNGNFEYAAIDQLTFDVGVPNAAALAGGTVLQEDAGKSPVALGPIATCFAPQTACSGTSVCLLTGSPLKIRVQTKVAWTPQRAWTISVQLPTARTNSLNALISRPDQLPSGNVAGIALVTAQRTASNMGTYTISAYSPGVAGRYIVFTREVYSGSTLLSTDTTVNDEATDRNVETDFGSIMLPAGDATVTATVEERDHVGAVLIKQTKTITVK